MADTVVSVGVQAPEYSYKESNWFQAQIKNELDGIETRYLTGYADLMLASTWSLQSSSEEALELLEAIDLSQIMLALHGAYVASALRGEAVRIWYTRPEDGLGFRWEFDRSASFLTQNGRDGWIALESLPRFRRHYERYRKVLDSLPELLVRLELIDIEDKELNRKTATMTEAEIKAKMAADSAMLSQSMRNDGFLLHGPDKSITVHHRQSQNVISGIEELKKDVLASTDYTESHLWREQKSSGLSGISQQERDTVQAQTAIRIARCWRPIVMTILANILDYYGVDADVNITWIPPINTSVREQAEAELMNARAAKIRMAAGIFSAEEERNRYQGSGQPSPYPIPDYDTKPRVCPVICAGDTLGGGDGGGGSQIVKARDPNGRFLRTATGGGEGSGIARDGGIKRIIKIGGLEFGLELDIGDVRWEGKPHEKIMKAGYGHLRKHRDFEGDDEALDFYFPKAWLDGDVSGWKMWRIQQLDGDGFADESKIVFGKSAAEARSLYADHMPEMFFGGIRELKPEELDSFKVDAVVADAQRYQVTKGMIKNAARGLQLRRIHKHGGTIVGVSRARDISNNRKLSLETVKRMYLYFGRHIKDKQTPGFRTQSSAGYIAWLLWGGDEGFAWVKSIRAQAIRAGSWYKS